MKKLKLVISFLFLTAVLSAQRQVAYLDYPIPDRKYPVSPSASMEVEFEIINGLIVIIGELEGQTGSFILDTGAPGLVVNELAEPDPALEARSIGGTVAVSERLVKNLQWAGLELQDISAYAIDMHHLEESIDRKLLGLLGFELLSDYEIMIDYSNETLVLYPLENSLVNTQEPRLVLPFKMQQHLPIVKVKIGNKQYRFGIDCGASVNLIDARHKKRLEKYILEAGEEACLRGIDGQGEWSSIIRFTEIQIAGEPHAGGEFQWSTFNGLTDQGLQIDGLLGAEFFQTNRISIQYQDQKIFFW